MKPIEYLRGNNLSTSITDSIELRLLKQQLTDFFEATTREENLVQRFQDMLDVLVKQVQTEAKYDGYFSAMREAINTGNDC